MVAAVMTNPNVVGHKSSRIAFKGSNSKTEPLAQSCLFYSAPFGRLQWNIFCL